MIVLIDNYDSFTYNVYQLVGCLNPDIRVFRNDQMTVEKLEKLNPDHLIISPGPGFPATAGITLEAIRRFYQKIPVLGICLGHQAIAEALGGKVVHAPQPMHGKRRRVQLDRDCPLFAGLPETLNVARYHSLIVDRDTLPAELVVTARAEAGEIMGLRHKNYPLYGLQFHPESILTEQGERFIENFLRL
ncbi:aminodeoxychorismate/anthranilate synthase component II [Desulfitobacterium sp.]|uniref:anthranilate synthase component II n=1 Tax=Desulfitobacterium sp. TaxID=49981 RepID=UPI002B1EE05B|nr:aminodeoxychorismate/anthranilate synthase component II [Desulfitobacterium sp.]MEA4902614.1 aminodeoxychorismate/anthranilate synthase component II [Desulfitobacterium sp.]